MTSSPIAADLWNEAQKLNERLGQQTRLTIAAASGGMSVIVWELHGTSWRPFGQYYRWKDLDERTLVNCLRETVEWWNRLNESRTKG